MTTQTTQPDQAIKERQFLRATRVMMDALEVAEGMSSHELECLRHNTDVFLLQMVEDAALSEQRRRYPMGRRDWGKGEERAP